MYLVALEEHLLIQALRALLPVDGKPCPPNLALAARNDIVAIAQDLLSGEALPTFLRYADELALHLQGETRVMFPPLPRAAAESGTPAEACAEAHLLEGSGALWAAIRQVATLLPFRDDRRPHGNGRVIAFGAFNKGGLLGIHKHTTSHQAVCTLLNAAVRAVSAQHCWTTLVLTYNNHTTPHYDKGNSEVVPSLLMGLTHHDSGEVWIEQPGGRHYQLVDGSMVAGELHHTSACGLLFSGAKQCHATCQWSGARITLIAYTIRCHDLLLQGVTAAMASAADVPPGNGIPAAQIPPPRPMLVIYALHGAASELFRLDGIVTAAVPVAWAVEAATLDGVMLSGASSLDQGNLEGSGFARPPDASYLLLVFTQRVVPHAVLPWAIFIHGVAGEQGCRLLEGTSGRLRVLCFAEGTAILGRVIAAAKQWRLVELKLKWAC
ncbi:unnamed protein product [Symbiodinium necroappetens]|uniref:Uncharacterized protein n=1 Tax=Symbiodinium necroappetens TaxID=1628268 RepID=A0A812UQ15_9DINO|nr:unnamed protein product [Symbiodinium necroappetens]